MAVTMVSASMPFSLASASIVCINGFCIVVVPTADAYPSKLHFQSSARDQAHRQPMHACLRTFEQHNSLVFCVFLHTAQPSLECLLVVDRFAYDDLLEATGKPAVILWTAHRSVEPRRRDVHTVG